MTSRAPLLVLFAAGCAPLPRDVDATAAVPREAVGRPVLELRWKRVLVDHSDDYRPQEFASPAIYHERLYVGSGGGTFYALDAAGGRVIWKKKLGAVSGRPLVASGRLYIGTDDGFLVCADTFDGTEYWRYPTRGAILETPVLASDMVFFANEADQVYALDAETGKFRWQYKAEAPEEFTLRGHAGITLDGELLFTGFANGTVVALRAATGSVAWMTSLKGAADRFVDVDTTPWVVGDTVFAASSAGGVHALDAATGLIRWHLDVEGTGAIAYDDGHLYFGAADLGIYSADTTGNVVWRQGTRGGGEFAVPIVTGGYLVYALSGAGLFVADKRTGALFQYFDPGYGVSAEPALDGDALYVLSNGGILYAMSVERF